MNCPLCGGENPEGAFFCRACSSPMAGGPGAGAQPGPPPPAQPSPIQPAQPPSQAYQQRPPQQQYGQVPGGVAPPSGAYRAPITRADASASGFDAYLKLYGPVLAMAAGGALFLRLAVEVIVRLFPGKTMIFGEGSKMVMSDTFGWIGGALGIILVVAVGVAVGYLAGRLYPDRGALMGAVAGASVWLLEVFLSVVRVGTVARIVLFTKGTPGFNWSYCFALMVALVPMAAIAGWAASGMGMERVHKSGLKFAILASVGGLVVILLIVGAIGGLMLVTRKFNTERVNKAFSAMESNPGWTANFIYTPPKSDGTSVASMKYAQGRGYELALPNLQTGQVMYHSMDVSGKTSVSNDSVTWQAEAPTLGIDIMFSDRTKNMKVTGEWAGYWSNSSCAAIEVTAKSADFPLLEEICRTLPGAPTLDGGSGEFQAVVWTDLFYDKVLGMTCLLYEGKDLKPGSGGRIDVVFTGHGKSPFVEERAVPAPQPYNEEPEFMR